MNNAVCNDYQHYHSIFNFRVLQYEKNATLLRCLFSLAQKCSKNLLKKGIFRTSCYVIILIWCSLDSAYSN